MCAGTRRLSQDHVCVRACVYVRIRFVVETLDERGSQTRGRRTRGRGERTPCPRCVERRRTARPHGHRERTPPAHSKGVAGDASPLRHTITRSTRGASPVIERIERIERIESIESIHGSVSFLSVCPWALPGWAAVASRLNPQHPWSGSMGNQVRPLGAFNATFKIPS